MSGRFSVFVVFALVLAACGGDDDDSTDGDSNESWCALAQRIENSNDELDRSFDASDDALEGAFIEFGALLDDAEGSAPDEISDAVGSAAKGVETFRDLLDDVDFDVFALDENSIAELVAIGEEMSAATDEIEAYNLRQCGIAPSPEDSESSDESPPVDESSPVDESDDDEVIEDPSPPADEADDDEVTFVGDANSDWCVTSRQLDIESDGFDSLDFADAAAVQAAFTEMVGLYQGATQFTPPELENDVEISFSAILAFQEALIAADYDFLLADLSILEDVDGDVEAANDNIELYNEQVCDIPADVDVDADGDGSDFDPNAGTIREQAVAGLVETGFSIEEAECILDRIDITDPNLGTDIDAMAAVFDECGIDLARLAEIGG